MTDSKETAYISKKKLGSRGLGSLVEKPQYLLKLSLLSMVEEGSEVIASAEQGLAYLCRNSLCRGIVFRL